MTNLQILASLLTKKKPMTAKNKTSSVYFWEYLALDCFSLPRQSYYSVRGSSNRPLPDPLLMVQFPGIFKGAMSFTASIRESVCNYSKNVKVVFYGF